MTDDTTTWVAHGVAIVGLETTFKTDHDDHELANKRARAAIQAEWERVKDDPYPLTEVDSVERVTET